MAVLDQAQIAERIELYQRYADAQLKFAAVDAAMPEEAPSGLDVQWDDEFGNTDAMHRVSFVVIRAWAALRKAVLADAQKELDDAEQAVLKFERGEEVNAPK